MSTFAIVMLIAALAVWLIAAGAIALWRADVADLNAQLRDEE